MIELEINKNLENAEINFIDKIDFRISGLMVNLDD